MTVLDIPVGYASVFFMILTGYFVLTVWFGKPAEPIVQRATVRPPIPPATGTDDLR